MKYDFEQRQVANKILIGESISVLTLIIKEVQV